MSDTHPNPGPNGSQKWGPITRAGFQIVPDALFLKQRHLGLDQTDMLVLLNLNTFWWFKNSPPYSRTSVIARRMGVTQRTVQRSLKKLESSGLIRRSPFLSDSGETFPAIHLDGLISALEKLAKDDVALSARMEHGTSAKPEKDVALPLDTEHSATQRSEADEIPF
jgi:DNA-binding transcriptional ArsR family regulator